MLKENSALVVRGHRVLDICLTVAAFVAAYFIKRDYLPLPFRGLTTDPNYYVILLLIVIIWYIVLNLSGLYESYRRRTFSQIYWNMVKGVLFATVVLVLAMYVMKLEDVSRLMIGIFFFLNIWLLTLSKATAYRLLRHYRSRGLNFRNILVIGSGDRAKAVISAVMVDPGAGFRVLGCIGSEDSELGKEVQEGIRVIGSLNQTERLLREHVVDEIVFAVPLRDIESAEKHIALAEEMGVAVRILPDWQIHNLMKRPVLPTIHFENFFGVPSMALSTTSPKHAELLIKSAVDYLLAALLLLTFSPILAVIALAIKLFSPGPILFRQVRCGLNGRKFNVYKFRTMVADAEAKRGEVEHLNETDGPVFKISKDPRIIPYLGTFLRRTGLDELPQLINVLKGEMSIVGPRPPIPSEVDKYDLWQRRRLSMKPGMTCLWQTARNRNEVRFEDWMNLDLQYIDNWSLKLDFVILLKTIRVVFSGEGR
jgi:exopolysaccharide biosynthesis polyprenyl glycosylphosphotransferase